MSEIENSLADLPLTDLLDRFASVEPTPGGGSAAAMAGAFAGALVEMVVAVSTKSPDGTAVLADLGTRAQLLRGQLLDGADRDSQAFDEVRAAYRLPRETDEDKRRRKTAIQSAMKHAAEVPLENAALCLDAARLAREALDLGAANVTTDGAVGVLFALAGVEGAVLNVAVNLESIRDEDFVRVVKSRAESLLAESSTMRADLWALLRERLAALPKGE